MTKQLRTMEYQGIESDDPNRHTLPPALVRTTKIVDTPTGPMVLVTASIGESESNTQIVTFTMSIWEALRADIIERVE